MIKGRDKGIILFDIKTYDINEIIYLLLLVFISFL